MTKNRHENIPRSEYVKCAPFRAKLAHADFLTHDEKHKLFMQALQGDLDGAMVRFYMLHARTYGKDKR